MQYINMFLCAFLKTLYILVPFVYNIWRYTHFSAYLHKINSYDDVDDDHDDDSKNNNSNGNGDNDGNNNNDIKTLKGTKSLIVPQTDLMHTLTWEQDSMRKT